MLDRRLIRDDPDAVRANLARRGDDAVLDRLDEFLAVDKRWRDALQELNDLRACRNSLSRDINVARKKGEDSAPILKEAKELPDRIKKKDGEVKDFEDESRALLMRIPNLLHDSVPKGKDEEDNVEVKKWGKPNPNGDALKHHGELATSLGLADFERAVKIAGAGFYFLKGALARMDLALQMLACDMLTEKGYTLIAPPLMMRREPYEGVTDLADFENVMYKIEDEDQYLIATSEHPIGAMYQGEILDAGDLPLKYAGISPCFRREIGKHGLDERGLFRVHQFNKIEQFIFSRPDDSWQLHEELLANAESLMQKLELPYRVVNVCTGDIGTVAAKKYDVEGWSPREQKYIELMSCSNCTGYQATRLGIRMRTGQEKQAVHTLNSTMVATSRALRLILETYQTEEGGLAIPKALQPYLNGQKEIPQASR